MEETLYEKSIIEGGNTEISECLDECEIIEQLKQESYANGYRDGAQKVVMNCYKKGIISLEQAAEDTDMSTDAFAALVFQSKLV